MGRERVVGKLLRVVLTGGVGKGVVGLGKQRGGQKDNIWGW